MGFISSLFGAGEGSASRPERARGTLTPDCAVVYAIGDVHGCLDLLVALEDRIVSDSQRYASSRKAIVLLGDVIDRGPDSSGVIEHLLGEPPEGFVRFVLAGNHETAMLDFLDSPTTDDLWLHIGGEETLRSYGVGPLVRSPGRRERQRIADAAVASIPEEHIAFLRSLPVTLRWRDYLFVHAGIRPNMPLEEQIEADLQGIRDEFTASEADHRVVVVHGHTPTRQPVHRPNRIAVDLGAFATGRLAAVRLDGTDVAFLVAN